MVDPGLAMWRHLMANKPTRQARVKERATRQAKVKIHQKNGLGKLQPGGRHEAASTQHFLKSMGVTGPQLRKALKDLTEEAEQRSFWLWLRRKNQAWGKKCPSVSYMGATARKCLCCCSAGSHLPEPSTTASAIGNN